MPEWIVGLWPLGDTIYLTTYDAGGAAPNYKGRVVSLDPVTGTLTLIGNRFGNGSGENLGGIPYAVASFAGFLFVGTMGISGAQNARIYRILPGVDDTWAEDHAFGASIGHVMDVLPFQGNLYIALSGTLTAEARIDQRTPLGVYSTSFTAPTPNTGYCGALVEFDDALYACWFLSTVACLIKKFDGTTWTTDKDVGTDYAVLTHAPGTPFVFGGALYWPFFDATNDAALTGFLLKRTTGGTWSKAIDGRGLRGGLGVYRSSEVSFAFSAGFSAGFV
jgi:hypothetical protein